MCASLQVILDVDDGRANAQHASCGDTSTLAIKTFIIGASGPVEGGGDNHFIGCVRQFVVNNLVLDLAQALSSDILKHYGVNTSGNLGQCPTNSCQITCPANSQCTYKWSSFECECDALYQPEQLGCIDPCSSNPCQNGGNCVLVPQFVCQCTDQFYGEFCERRKGSLCPHGYYDSTCNKLCACDVEGSEEEICDWRTGECLCKVLVIIIMCWCAVHCSTGVPHTL